MVNIDEILTLLGRQFVNSGPHKASHRQSLYDVRPFDPNKCCCTFSFDKRRYFYFPSVLFCSLDEKDINSPLEAGAVVAENINVSFGARRERKRTKISF